MANFWLFDEFLNDLLKGDHDFSTDSFKVALTSTTPTKATNGVWADLSAGEQTGSGYTAGGSAVTLTITEPTAGTWQLGGTTNVPWTASAADWIGFRYAVVYNTSTAGVTNGLVGVLDYGSTVNLGNGATFTIDPGTNGWVQFVTPTWA